MKKFYNLSEPKLKPKLKPKPKLNLKPERHCGL